MPTGHLARSATSGDRHRHESVTEVAASRLFDAFRLGTGTVTKALRLIEGRA
jgi:hypothetical protein